MTKKIKFEIVDYMLMLLIFLSIVIVGLDIYLVINYFIDGKIVLAIIYMVAICCWIGLGILDTFQLKKSLKKKKRNKYLNSKYEDDD